MGVCVYCLQPGCKSGRCIAAHRLSTWEPCRRCDGTGYDQVDGDMCNCTGGLVETTGSITLPRRPLRPSRLNFAGVCIWCLGRWCESAQCLRWHYDAHWGIRKDCRGLGFQEDAMEACGCFSGLVGMSKAAEATR